MLSTNAVNVNNAGLAAQMGAGSVMTPETGGFDFLSYLLGLQVTSLTGTPGDLGGEFATRLQGADGQSDLLANLSDSQKKDLSLVQPLFPGLTVAQSPIQSNSGKNGLEAANGISLLATNQGSQKAIAGPALTALNLESGANAVRFSEMQPNQTVGNDLSASNNSVLGEMNTQGLQAFDAKQVVVRDQAMQKYGALLNKENVNSQESSQQVVSTRADATMQNNPFVQNMGQNQALNNKAAEIGKEVELSLGSDKKKSNPFDSSFDGVDFNQLTQTAKANIATTLTGGEEKGREVSSSPTTVSELFNRVESMVNNGGGKMTVSLNPPDLGHVEIQVRAKGKQIEIQMKSDNEFAKAALESQLGELKSSIHAQDLVVSKMEVTVHKEGIGSDMSGNTFAGLSNNASNFQQTGGSFQQHEGGRQSNVSRELDTPRATAIPAMNVPQRVSSVSNGRVDIRV